MPRIVRTKQAEVDADAIWSWVARERPGAADRLLDRFDQAVDLHSEFPRAGRSREDLAAGMRVCSVPPYLIFYREITGGIEIARVLDGRRDIGPEMFD